MTKIYEEFVYYIQIAGMNPPQPPACPVRPQNPGEALENIPIKIL